MGFGEIGENGEGAQRNEAELSFDDGQGEGAGKDSGVDGGEGAVGEISAGFDEGCGGEAAGRINAGDEGERREVVRGGGRERGEELFHGEVHAFPFIRQALVVHRLDVFRFSDITP